MCMGVVCIHVCTLCMPCAHKGQKRARGPMELELQISCEPPHGHQELQEQQMLLTAEPFPQPHLQERVNSDHSGLPHKPRQAR